MKLRRDPDRDPRERRVGVIVVGVLCALGAAGGAMVALTTLSPQDGPAQPRASVERVSVGAATLTLPSDWLTSRDASEVAGLPHRSPVLLAPASSVTLALVHPPNGIPLPAEVAHSVESRAGPPTTEEIGPLSAYRWLVTERDSTATLYYAVLTTDGTVALACRGPESARVQTDCRDGLTSLRVDPARALPASPGGLFLQALTASVQRLNEQMPPAREALAAAAGKPLRLAGAADHAARIAGAEADALAAAAPLQDPEADRTVAAVRALADTHARLARAARLGGRGAYVQARDAIGRAERDLDAALLEWQRRLDAPAPAA